MNDKCSQCGYPLTKRELLTQKISGSSVCDTCVGRGARVKLLSGAYDRLLSEVPQLYRKEVFCENDQKATSQKSAVIIAEESPVTATQWLWDMVKRNWKNHLQATYLSMNTIAAEYSAKAWQQKHEYAMAVSKTAGLLCIDDITHNSPNDLLRTIVEYRAENDMHTVIVVRCSSDEISKIMGDKAEAMVKRSWKFIGLESS